MIPRSGVPSKRFTLFVFFFLPIISFCQPSLQYSTPAEELFTNGLNLYKKGDFKSAAEIFGKVARGFGLNHRTTAAFVMKAKAELYGGDTAQAEKTLQTFLTSYSASSYTPDAEYTLGLLYIKRRDYEKGVSSLLNSLRSIRSTSSGLKESNILLLLDETIDKYIDAAALQRLAGQAKNLTEEEYLRVKIGEKQLALGDYLGTKATLDLLSEKFTRPAFREKISALEARLVKPRPLKLGVLLPLMRKGAGSREKETGVSVLEGIEFALEEHLKKTSANISLEIRDTGNDLPVALAAAKELAEDQSVVLVLGPAFSNESLTVRAVANDKSVPMITPTATANGIATKGQFMFQANPDMDTRAKAMAQHAVKTLRLKRIAVLSPEVQPQKALADVFAKEVKRLGGNIVAFELYERGISDLTRQLTVLRRKAGVLANQPFITFNYKITMNEIGKLSRLGVPMNVLDTLLVGRSVVNATDLLGENAKAKLLANAIPFSVGDPRLDSLQRITTAIDAVYCPIASSSEIGIVSSQIVYAGFTARILGSGEWNNLAELKTNRRSSNGVQFESDGWLDARNPLYADFANRFFQRYGRMPGKNNVYGYDVAHLALTLIGQGAMTREEMKNALSRVTSFESLHSKISFSSRRTNTWLNILEYSNETIQRVNELNIE